MSVQCYQKILCSLHSGTGFLREPRRIGENTLDLFLSITIFVPCIQANLKPALPLFKSLAVFSLSFMTRSLAFVIYTNSLDSFTGEETNWEFIYSVTAQENYVLASVMNNQKLNGMASEWCMWFQCSQHNHHLITERVCKEIATNCINLKMKITILPIL